MEQTAKQRTLKQNRALHAYFGLLADELNTAGLDMKRVLKPHIDIPWSTETIKEYIWRPIQEVQLRKHSTTELSTKDIDKVFETINRFIGDRFGLHIAFPSIEEQMNEYYKEAKEGRKNT